jgi:hypothetical protein
MIKNKFWMAKENLPLNLIYSFQRMLIMTSLPNFNAGLLWRYISKNVSPGSTINVGVQHYITNIEKVHSFSLD